MEYSKDFWRGLFNQSFITNNRPNINAFQFDENPDRKDSFKELSINWNDDPKSLEILLNQRKEKDNQIQFKAGAARIEFTMLKMMIRRKPIREGDGDGDCYLRPSCDYTLGEINDKFLHHLPFCWMCGQALDWSEPKCKT